MSYSQLTRMQWALRLLLFMSTPLSLNNERNIWDLITIDIEETNLVIKTEVNPTKNMSITI